MFIEVKSGNATQSLEQKNFQKRVRQLGFDYEVVHSLDEFVEILRGINEGAAGFC